ncbi:class I SAM-dependent DNA methyltransferase [Acinetobacter nosocomialis]|uniref:DNA methyltransferase n=1 Tax=Acinetobacter TaxID=469 RepID=UPI0002EE38BC|nr:MULTISPECIES: DNA methyltransferase [Acinetobacter]MCT9372710.1 N-6 DNA methylase [Acinetobacter baumannii]QNY27045.1 class I SAM-dependent DNA methyltransferase [Acinetobacter seifertii]AWL20504.1 class I SAM-dependent DNA methyltransferase [Acinetobacter nosocomialis]MCU4407005.1 N-6 DNA methylase [Acinetobacter junii]HAV6231952.1 class I SAM-dependent DNA methyltransferase [Acinetobacter baumannii]
MNIIQIEENIKQLIHLISQGKLAHKDFIYELLLAYGHRSQSIGRVRNGERNLAEDKENSVFWKRQIYFKIAKQDDLHGLIDQMKNEKRTESNKIRFLIVTDFKNLLAVDTKTQDTLDIPFGDLAKKFDFFLPWAGMEKAVYQGENPADVKAAEKLAKLFDEIKADNFNEDDLNNKENLHHLNIFLSRLLFCYFAEDTEIFKDKQFTSAISKSNEDGSDLSALIGRLFKVLNQSSEDREADLPDYLADFPYVNGGLFKDDIQVPKFTRKSRRILIECGAELDWSDINPDIFGSMFQAVVHTEQRSTMGQHYTSVPNIMKVIEPLFLNDLYEELEKNQDSVNKLLKLQQRLGQLKIFDPACGSGNFLIIAYKELRKFEMELLKRIQELELEKTGQFSKPFSVIQVSQFYGIEIDDFAHEIAILSLWLTEHQMNIIFKDEFGESKALLPLRDSGNIVQGNSLQINWKSVCNNADSEVYILSNPPYMGFKMQDQKQKQDMERIFKEVSNYKFLDYIACWFMLASDYINENCKVGFVSTNSICQGVQVELLWPEIYKRSVDICFAHQSFKWSNNARSNAGVTCVIIGLQHKDAIKTKTLINNLSKSVVKNINSYLIDSSNVIVAKRRVPLSKLPKISDGSGALDGGNLILSSEEKAQLILADERVKPFVRNYTGSNEFINGIERYCLWIEDNELEQALTIPLLKERIDAVKEFRSNAGTRAQTAISRPHKFAWINQPQQSQIIIPTVSSERREYIPMGFSDISVIVSNSASIVHDPEPYVFALLQSKMHMVWTKTLAGRLRTDIRYTSAICYNTFPVPKLMKAAIFKLNESAFKILAVRESYSHLSLAQLYDPEKMPLDLKQAHIENDLLVEKLYKSSEFKTDEERLERLFHYYETMLN